MVPVDDKITRLERILNIVERARNLDLMTAQVIGQINHQQVQLYREITEDYDLKNRDHQNSEKIANSKLKGFSSSKSNTANNEVNMETKMSPTELMDYFAKAVEDFKKVKETPPESPTPPENPTPIPQKDLETLNKLKNMSATVSEHLKIQVDMHKYAAAAIYETHKLSFDLYKEVDAYMKTQT